MIRKIFTSALLAVLVSCGGSDAKNESAAPTTETKKDDKTQDPAYQNGLAIVAEPKNLCLTCHKIDEKLVGPAYRDVANKYDLTDENIDKLAEKVVKGGTGVWGEVPMPANAVISLDDAKAAVRYVLMLRNK
ncbi:MAG TPA: c-type cytochrome [Chitinophagaceae bacterium]|nr:c-type cytochrome [Chitinophagaceae bacterium]